MREVRHGLPRKPSARIGAQLWVDREDTTERVHALVRTAADVGIGQLRIFLMWPWIEDEKGVYDFRLFDDIFDAADLNGVGIKATLTANSGPWWLGTPGVLHSQTPTLDSALRPAMEAYVSACASRYAARTSLRQWILWNEPQYPAGGFEGDPIRTDEQAQLWTALLRRRFGGDVAALNRRFKTGYEQFRDVPFAELIPHPTHRDSQWRSYGPILADAALRSEALIEELSWLADGIRRHDSSTELCVNPNLMLDNHAAAGYDLPGLAATVDVLGASFHAPWHFTFAERDTHTGLIVSGASLLASTPGDHTTEVTEAQFGNTYLAGRNSLGISAGQLLGTVLAPLLADAMSVTGWCLNSRRQDFEAGDWGLLDDDDRPGRRAVTVSRAADVLAALDHEVGSWSAVPRRAWVLTSEASQAVQWAQAQNEGFSKGGRSAHVASQGAGLLTVELLRLGVAAGQAPTSALTGTDVPGLLVAAGITAWNEELAGRLLELTADGRTLLLDATCGQYDLDVNLHQPWPGHLSSAAGYRIRGLLTQHDGTGQWPATVHGAPAGGLPGVTADVLFEPGAGWSSCGEPRLADDFSPVLWRRPFGAGTIYLMTGSLAGAALEAGMTRPLVRCILETAAAPMRPDVRPLSDRAFSLEVAGERGAAIGVFGPDVSARAGRPLRVAAPAGTYHDLVTGELFDLAECEDLILPAVDGVAVLVRR